MNHLTSPLVVAKKLCDIIQIVFFMVKNNLFFYHHHHLSFSSCRPDDVLSFMSTQEMTDDGDSQVDFAAEEFINKFYKDLRLQRRWSAFESPAHNR
ncbi:hypothetical protein HRI_003153300 [Hibiscus trionum]|uniref:Uncharacterized protein n=1 Tax=Hibiscus trionum TaxID=183268 RepID=A0A9W7IHK0_HIBTR|nr:hypothetical protein HRI_003153300 [Hibiscus trionum]